MQQLVSKLRRVLAEGGAPGRVVTRPPGYCLDEPRDAVDALRFERLVGDARAAAGAGDPSRAVRLVEEALGLWRGEAFAGATLGGEAAGVRTRMTELRDAAVDDRVDWELQRGNHTGVVAELEAAVAATPLRERRWGQLMVALYRCGRQSDALRTYRRRPAHPRGRARRRARSGAAPAGGRGPGARSGTRRPGGHRRGGAPRPGRARAPPADVLPRPGHRDRAAHAPGRAARTGHAGRPGRRGQDPPRRRGRGRAGTAPAGRCRLGRADAGDCPAVWGRRWATLSASTTRCWRATAPTSSRAWAGSCHVDGPRWCWTTASTWSRRSPRSWQTCSTWSRACWSSRRAGRASPSRARCCSPSFPSRSRPRWRCSRNAPGRSG